MLQMTLPVAFERSTMAQLLFFNFEDQTFFFNSNFAPTTTIR